MGFNEALNPRTLVRVDRRAGHGTVSVKRDVFRLWKRQENRAPPQILLGSGECSHDRKVSAGCLNQIVFECGRSRIDGMCPVTNHGALSSDRSGVGERRSQWQLVWSCGADVNQPLAASS